MPEIKMSILNSNLAQERRWQKLGIEYWTENKIKSSFLKLLNLTSERRETSGDIVYIHTQESKLVNKTNAKQQQQGAGERAPWVKELAQAC